MLCDPIQGQGQGHNLCVSVYVCVCVSISQRIMHIISNLLGAVIFHSFLHKVWNLGISSQVTRSTLLP